MSLTEAPIFVITTRTSFQAIHQIPLVMGHLPVLASQPCFVSIPNILPDLS